MDLASLDTGKNSDEGVWMELESPKDGEPLGMHIKVLGKDSKEYKSQIRKNNDKKLKKGFRNLKFEKIETEEIELLTACTADWKGVVYNGEELEFSRENVRWLYKTYSWAKEQVDEFIGDRSNFLGE
jgi:hypothetical protein